MKAFRVVMVAAALLASMAPHLSRAWQDAETLPVTPGAGAFLPDAEQLGEGWVLVMEAGIAPGPELFTEGVKAVYGGPEGSRAVVYAWITRDSTANARRSWHVIAEFMGSTSGEWGSDFPVDRANEIATLSPPDGCLESSRADGIAAGIRFPVGLTLCAVDPDVLIMTIVSGEFGGETGYLASDALVQTALLEAAE
jgi:hypothetical protein